MKVETNIGLALVESPFAGHKRLSRRELCQKPRTDRNLDFPGRFHVEMKILKMWSERMPRPI